MYVSWWFPFSAVAMNMAPSIPREFSCRLKVHAIRIVQTCAKANLQRFQRWVHLNQNWCIWMRRGQEIIRRYIMICDRLYIIVHYCASSLLDQIWPNNIYPWCTEPFSLPLSVAYSAPPAWGAVEFGSVTSATCTGCNHYWHSTSTIFNSICYYYSLLLFCPAMLLLLCLFSRFLLFCSRSSWPPAPFLWFRQMTAGPCNEAVFPCHCRPWYDRAPCNQAALIWFDFFFFNE